MKWNMRLVAAERGIWKAADLRQLLAEHGLSMSAGKMSGLWSGKPTSVKLADLDVVCSALDCHIDDLLIPESEHASPPRLAPVPDVPRHRRDESSSRALG